MAELDLGKVVMDSYNDLDNKPKINEVELRGNKTLEDLGIQQLIDAVNVSRLSKDVFAPSFETLEDFVVATATDVSVPHFGRMYINTRNWGFGTSQIRYLITYMRAYTVGVLDVLGSGIFWDDTNTMWHVEIHGGIGELYIQHYKIEPNQIPTNNLLATEAGTPLDAAQGKVLYDRINNTNVSRKTASQYNTLEEFVENTASSINVSHMGRFKDLGGFTSSIGAGAWKRYLISYQNQYASGVSSSVHGDGFFFTDDAKVYSIKINGNKDSGLTLTYEKLTTETELSSVIKTKLSHKEYIPWTSINSGSYAAGEKRYTKADIGLIKELLFVFQENSVYESMAYEYVSITTGYGNLTTCYYQAQTTKGLFRIYYSEEGYIDIREVPNGLGIRSALYLPKI